MVINLHRYRYSIVFGLFLALVPFIHKYGVGKPQVQKHKNQFQYGAYLPWQEVQEVFPCYANATVIDFDSKKNFQVQRRAGEYHADVQPLTAVDTAVMKEICGTWSWKRRAIILKLESGRRIAASMACMPHGAGAIQGNNFNGHFCIHFRDSKTHASNKKDLAHQIMIWKAAGLVDSQLKLQNAADTIRIFFTAVDQGDQLIPGRILLRNEERLQTMESLRSIQSVKVNGIHRIDDQSYCVWLQVGFKESRWKTQRKFSLEIIQKDTGYKINPSCLVTISFG